MPELKQGSWDVVYSLEGPGEKFLVVTESPWKESPIPGTLEQVVQRVAESVGNVVKSATTLGTRLVGVKITLRSPEPIVRSSGTEASEPEEVPERSVAEPSGPVPEVCGGPGGPVSTMGKDERA